MGEGIQISNFHYDEPKNLALANNYWEIDNDFTNYLMDAKVHYAIIMVMVIMFIGLKMFYD
jgi:hypothetical protein